MKTKTIPFDLETVKKIQSGETEGKIKTSLLGNEVRILCYDFINGSNKDYKLICAIKRNNAEYILAYTEDGSTCNTDEGSLVLEVPDEVPDNKPQFKPFDKVLVRDRDTQCWSCSLFSHKDAGVYYACGLTWNQCIPYEGNEHLVGTTDKPKEE